MEAHSHLNAFPSNGAGRQAGASKQQPTRNKATARKEANTMATFAHTQLGIMFLASDSCRQKPSERGHTSAPARQTPCVCLTFASHFFANAAFRMSPTRPRRLVVASCANRILPLHLPAAGRAWEARANELANPKTCSMCLTVWLAHDDQLDDLTSRIYKITTKTTLTKL